MTALSKLMALLKNGSKDRITDKKVEAIILEVNPNAEVSDKVINDIQTLINNSATENGNKDITYSTLLKLFR